MSIAPTFSTQQGVTPAQQAALDALIGARATGSVAAVRVTEQQVINEHLGFATALARRYRGRGLEFDDLEQLARLGLVRAVKRWQPEVGADFLPYASPTILGEIRRYFRDHSTIIRAPRPLQELHQATGVAASELEQQLGRVATDVELAAAVGVTPDLVRQERAATRASRSVSLDVPAVHRVTEQLPHDHAETDLHHVEDAVTVRRAIAALNARDRQVLHLRFFQDNSQAQIAAVIGVSQMQVSRILRDITTRLRVALGADDRPGLPAGQPLRTRLAG